MEHMEMGRKGGPGKTEYKVHAVYGNLRRDVVLRIGDEYEFQPLRGYTHRNKGRIGILEWFHWKDGVLSECRVRFSDTGRQSKVKPEHLLPTDGSAVLYHKPVIRHA